jgi:hypothetical protein
VARPFFLPPIGPTVWVALDFDYHQRTHMPGILGKRFKRELFQ